MSMTFEQLRSFLKWNLVKIITITSLRDLFAKIGSKLVINTDAPLLMRLP